MRLRLRARDVSVATVRPEAISIHNILPAIVTGVEPAGPHEVLLTLHVGPTALLARLARHAIARLGLVSGASAYVLVKSTAFDHG